MAERVEFEIAFVHYDLVQLARLDGKEVLAFPGARPVDRQQELAVAPILEVRPAAGARGSVSSTAPRGTPCRRLHTEP